MQNDDVPSSGFPGLCLDKSWKVQEEGNQF